jgi:hypothetical protein
MKSAAVRQISAQFLISLKFSGRAVSMQTL